MNQNTRIHTGTIEDEIYGSVSIEEPILWEVLNSAPVQRLRGIHQAGASYLMRAGRDGSRFDHVVGVMLLIRRLGGSIEEQIAGLLHDVSHTAFSHVSDQVFARTDEDFHEDHFERMLIDSAVPNALTAHGITLGDILDVHRWSLLEQPSPDLCADRVDYTLRDLKRIGAISAKEIRLFLNDLKAVHGRMVLGSPDIALWFTKRYAEEVSELFMNPVEIFANNQLAKAIKRALELGCLTVDDLFADDEWVMKRLQHSGDGPLAASLATLSPNTRVIEDKNDYFLKAHSKARWVDPMVVNGEESPKRCSEIFPEVHDLHQLVRDKAAAGIFVRVLSS